LKRALGYAEMRLYAAFAFVSAPPVSSNPLPSTAFLGLRLT
jgi:hypothetical protein